MKKSNKLMRASGILLVLTLATSCFVGGTFAKYLSEDDGSDTARVAKWGVEVEVANGEGFHKYYGKDDHDENVITQIDGKYVSVSSEDKVIAPGTKGSFGGYDGNNEALPVISFSGEPEVAAEIKTTAKINLGSEDLWTVNKGKYDEKFYCPLVFTISNSDGDKEVICGMHYTSGNGGYGGLINKIQSTLYTQSSKVVEAGEDIGEFEVYCSWAWPFENSKHTEFGCVLTDDGNANAHDMDQEDTLDTALGNKAADYEELEITLDLETTVTQID